MTKGMHHNWDLGEFRWVQVSCVCGIREIRWLYLGRWKNPARERPGFSQTKALRAAPLYPISLSVSYFPLPNKLANLPYFLHLLICPIPNVAICSWAALQTLHSWADLIQSFGATMGEENTTSFHYTEKMSSSQSLRGFVGHLG